MSPERADDTPTRTRFPRVSGDEPERGQIRITWKTFSPRERG